MSSTLKILSDVECQVYCDYEYKGDVVPGTIFRIDIRKGTYILEFKKDNVVLMSQDYEMCSNDEEQLLRVTLSDKVVEQSKKIQRESDNVLKNAHYLFVDTETTGLPKDRKAPYYSSENWPYIVQISIIVLDINMKKIAEENFILAPENYTIPQSATDIHGITNEYAKKYGKKRKVVLEHIIKLFRTVDFVVGHNVDFDINVLKAEIYREFGGGVWSDLPNYYVIDTMKMGVDICKIPSFTGGYKWPKLDELYEKLFGKSFQGQHNAMNDVKATYECYCKMTGIFSGEVAKADFSVSEDMKVVFSPGNLQYQASTNKWRFAENPWYCVGEANKNISASYSGWIDLFGWGTGDNPTKPLTNVKNYSSFKDWGDYCGLPIPEGATGKWRTLTEDEWWYVMFKRTTSSGIRYAKAQVNSVNGIIVVPDEWNKDIYSLNNTDDRGADFEVNVISASTWESILEPAGCVFLPAAGYDLCLCGSYGSYWSSTPDVSDKAYYLHFRSDECRVVDFLRDSGFSVRLVANHTGFVDLGLPSGTLWKDKNEEGGFYTYDEAMSKFGNELPTKEQFEELVSSCEWTWTGSGYRVTGPSGASITLPAAGSRTGSDVSGVGRYGDYWSSTLDDSDDAYFLEIFFANYCVTYGVDRSDGFSVRLVALPQY